MKKVHLIAAILVVALLVTGGNALAGVPTQIFRANLTAEGDDVETAASGKAKFLFSQDEQELRFGVVVKKLENVTMAHIHLAEEAGGDGPPVLWLYPAAPPAQLIPGVSKGVLADGTATAADLVGPLAGKSLEDLKTAMEEGLTYVNVHTSAFPGGEIRGEIEVK